MGMGCYASDYPASRPVADDDHQGEQGNISGTSEGDSRVLILLSTLS